LAQIREPAWLHLEERAAFASLDLNGFYRRMRDAERGVNHRYFTTPEDSSLAGLTR
jgi:hypothetical protein